MTKTKELIFKILSRAPLSVTLIAFFFMPDTVPVHFNMSNQVDRWGSKYELIILPCVVLVMGIIFVLVAKFLDKREEHGNNNYNILITVGICLLGIFNILTYVTLYFAFAGLQDSATAPIDVLSLITLLIGVMMIVIGNIVPKAKMNSMLGLRTKWSMSSEDAWRKSQRFGGYAAIIAGVLMIVESLIFSEMTTIILMLVILFVMTIADTMYSYFASK